MAKDWSYRRFSALFNSKWTEVMMSEIFLLKNIWFLFVWCRWCFSEFAIFRFFVLNLYIFRFFGSCIEAAVRPISSYARQNAEKFNQSSFIEKLIERESYENLINHAFSIISLINSSNRRSAHAFHRWIIEKLSYSLFIWSKFEYSLYSCVNPTENLKILSLLKQLIADFDEATKNFSKAKKDEIIDKVKSCFRFIFVYFCLFFIFICFLILIIIV